MIVGIQIAWVIILTGCGWLYLEWEGANNKKEVIQESGYKKKLYAFFMCIGGMGLVWGLNSIFLENHYLMNLKLVTLVMFLFPIAWKDFTDMIIPNRIIGTGLIIRVLFYILELFIRPESFFTIIKQDLYACVIAILFLIVGTFVVKNGIGMGDIKLLLLMGVFQGIFGIFSALFISLLILFLAGIYFLITRKKGKRDFIPFAPSILIGTYISVLLTGM